MTTPRPSSRVCRQGLVVLALLAAACSVGQGSGTATGPLNVAACSFDSSGRPIPLVDPAYNLKPNFFVAHPIDSNSPRFPANQLMIRLQYSGQRVELTDALFFWIFDSHEVARCVRGRMNADGTPDWNPLLCDRSPAAVGAAGEGRLFVGMTTEVVRSFLRLTASCPQAVVSANALGSCADGSCPDVTLCPGRGSWISFSRFGNPPGDVTQAVAPNFRVNDSEQIRASGFHVELCDSATVLSILDRLTPVPAPNVVATLDGAFEFELERGQGGQPFP